MDRFAVGLLVTVVLFVVRAWAVMLAFGVLHAAWRQAPAIGWPTALALTGCWWLFNLRVERNAP